MLPASLEDSRPVKRSHKRLPHKKYRSGLPKSEKVDAATLASTLQLQEQQRELIYSIVALLMKLGLIAVGALSLLNLGLASHKRVDRHSEIVSVLGSESLRLVSLQKSFDNLFTIGGDRRLMDENDQWITPNRVRVIWR